MKTILLADDSITIQKVVELTFSEGAYQVVCVSNGAQALKKIPEVLPDIVLLDVIMPEKNGYEVCEEIKRRPATSGIPVLLLTGTFEPFDRRRAEAAGADGHLTKPFESQSLVAKVEELIAARPSVSTVEEAGNMEVISGGALYKVGTEARDQHLEPSGLDAPPGPSPRAMDRAAEAAVIPPRAIPAPPTERNDETAERVQDASGNGSHDTYETIAPYELASEAVETEIIPDRYDADPAPSGATVRLNREDLFKGRDLDAADDVDVVPIASPRAAESPDGVENLIAAFEIEDPGPLRADDGEGWTPPSEAPPPEAWQTQEEDAMSSAPFEPPSPARPSGTPQVAGNGGSGLSPEAIDLIAERVVERISDRVVREIAWEVIPQIAEAIIKRRIKDLEEGTE